MRPEPMTQIVLPLAHWPELDRRLWAEGVLPARGIRRRHRHAQTLTPRSIRAARQGWGRFLAVLAERGGLDPAIGPAQRASPASLAEFFDALCAAGNIANSIKARLFHVRMALWIMAPAQNFDWITRPDGVALDSLLLQAPDDEPPPATAIALFKWGLGMMPADALPEPASKKIMFCRDYRDGLIIALLASRAPRLGALAQMRLGQNLYRLNGEVWVRLQSEIVKNKRSLEYSLPPELTPCVDRYLSEIRPVLVDVAATDALWGNGKGGTFTGRSIQKMINRRTARNFPRSFGPHVFRDAFATSLAEHDPCNPGLAAVVLGLTEGVVAAHYRKARQRDAARKLQGDLREERQRTRRVAKGMGRASTNLPHHDDNAGVG